MDDNTTKVWIAALGLVGGLATGIVVAALGYRFSRTLEGDKRTHEAANRWVQDRRQLYARFLVVASKMRDTIKGRVDLQGVQREAFDDIDRSAIDIAYQEVRLIARPETLDTISWLHAHLVVAAVLVEGPGDDANDVVLASSRIDSLREISNAWNLMVEAMRDDLGVEPELPYVPRDPVLAKTEAGDQSEE